MCHKKFPNRRVKHSPLYYSLIAIWIAGWFYGLLFVTRQPKGSSEGYFVVMVGIWAIAFVVQIAEERQARNKPKPNNDEISPPTDTPKRRIRYRVGDDGELEELVDEPPIETLQQQGGVRGVFLWGGLVIVVTFLVALGRRFRL